MNGLLRHSASIWKGLSRAGFGAEYQAVYDSFTTKPSDSIAAAQNTMVESLVDAGVWTKLDVFYVLAGHTNGAGESLINWFNPGTFDATAVNSPTFTALEGFKGDGLTSYIDTNFDLLTNAVKYLLNSASYGVYIRDNINENALDCGVFDTPYRSHLTTRFTNLAGFRINNDLDSTMASNDSTGMWIASRTASNVIKLYRNKISVISDTKVSTQIPTGNFYYLGHNSNGTPGFLTTRQQSMGYIGEKFEQVDVDNLYDAFQAYMTSNGKQV